MDLHIAGKTALVCASTAGLGLASARALADEGCRVVVTGRHAEKAEQVAAEIGGGAIGIAADFSVPDAAEALASAASERLGGVDILVLNGPGPAPGQARDLDAEALHAAVGLVADNQVRLVRRALPGMRERGWGRIVSIASSGVQAPIPNLAPSNLARAALAGYLKTLAAEVAADGVTVNSVLPGRIATARLASLDAANAERTGRTAEQVAADAQRAIPAGRYGRPEEFGAIVAFIASAHASFITGSAIRCDGGMITGL